MDITTIPVEKRKFQPIERCWRNAFYAMNLIFVIGLNVIFAWTFLDDLNNDGNSDMETRIKWYSLMAQQLLGAIFAILAFILLSTAARAKQYYEWQEYKKKFFI